MAVCSMFYFSVISYFIISDIQCSERITAKNSTVTNSSKKKNIDLLQLINQETLIRFELDKNVHKINSKVETIKIDNKLASDRLNKEMLSINTTLSGLRKNQDETNEAVNIVKSNQTSTDGEVDLLKEEIESFKQKQKINQKLASDQFNQELLSINATLSGLRKNQDETNDSLLKQELKSLKQKLLHLEYNQQKLITDPVKDKIENALLKKEMESLKASQKELVQNVTGTLKAIKSVVYTRWGKKTCPDKEQLVYSGFTGGSMYNQKGTVAEPLCLPRDPEWGKYKSGVDKWRQYVYGAEYESPDLKGHLLNRDVPCAVCHVQGKSAITVFPARKTCYKGWTREYSGFLMAGYHEHPAASQYTCIDENPDFLYTGANINKDGYLLYPVESRCGSLHCPPYVDGRELVCVVCSAP